MRQKIYWGVMILFIVFSQSFCVSQSSMQSSPFARALRLIALAREKGWQISYTFCGADFPLDLRYVAVTQEKVSNSQLFLFSTQGDKDRLLWSRQLDNEWVSSIIPLELGDEQYGFLTLSRGGGGSDYRVLLVAVLDRRAHVVLNEIGYGLPYIPEMVRFGRRSTLIMIIPDIRDYPKEPTKAKIFVWDTKKRAFRKKVVAWKLRYSSLSDR